MVKKPSDSTSDNSENFSKKETTYDPRRNPLPQKDKNILKLFKASALGGFRTYLIIFGLKGLQNLLIYFIYSLKNKKKSPIQKIFLSKASHRLAFASGSFTFVWKILSWTLPFQKKYGNLTNDFIAGAIAGFCILFEEKKKRFDHSQTLIFRALQGVGNCLTQDGIINFPFASETFFVLSASQYMYTHVFYPEIYPESEIKLLNTMAGIPSSILLLNRRLLTGEKISPTEMAAFIPSGVSNKRNLEFIKNMPNTPPIIPCQALHLSNPTCTSAVVEKSIKAFRFMFPLYGAVNLGTKLLLSSSKLIQNPRNEFLGIFTKTLRSGVFIGTFVGIYQLVLCRLHNLYLYFPNFRIYRPLYFLTAAFTCIATYWIDSPKRLSNLSFFMAPRALYSAYKIPYLNGWFPAIPNFETLLFSFSTGVIMSCLKNRPDSLDPLIAKFIKFAVDPNLHKYQSFSSKKEDTE